MSDPEIVLAQYSPTVGNGGLRQSKPRLTPDQRETCLREKDAAEQNYVKQHGKPTGPAEMWDKATEGGLAYQRCEADMIGQMTPDSRNENGGNKKAYSRDSRS